MEKQIALSVIIPHHNIPNLLERCLNSIPERDCIQVIVVDDNSDSSIVDFNHFPGYNRDNVEIYLTKEGKGAGYARNVGLTHANGKWLLFADSDDFFVENFFDIVKDYFDSNYEEVVFKAKSVDSDTLEPSNRNENINKRIDQVLYEGSPKKNTLLKVQSPWCRLIRRDFVNNNNILFDEVLACNDAMFTTKVTCLAKEIGVDTREIYVVTYRTGSLWDSRKKNPQNVLIRLEVQIRINKYVKKMGFRQFPLIVYLKMAKDIGYATYFKALWIVVKTKSLFNVYQIEHLWK